LLTLFQVLTLEGWVELQRASMQVYPWAWVYYTSFVLIAVFVVVNLFIAVVLNNLEEARKAEAPPEPSLHDVMAELAAVRAELARIDGDRGERRPPPSSSSLPSPPSPVDA
jgi:voltage-gated sodium channel